MDKPASPEQSGSAYFIVLLVVCGLMFFTNLKSWHPTIMEARNFISAREMTTDGNWLIPTLNGDIRIRKPPLPTWLTALSLKASGTENNLTALRIPAAFIASLAVFFLFGLVKSVFKDPLLAFYSALALATSFMFVEEGRTGAWDIFCNSFMLGGIWMFYKAFSERSPIGYFILSAILLGFSFLSKGPVAFYAMLLPFLLAVFISRTCGFNRAKLPGLLVCILVVIVISAAWPLYLHFKIPDLSQKIAVEEASAWIEKHNRPVWYYLHFPLFTGIWTILLLFGLFRFKSLYLGIDRKKVLMVVLWIIFTIVLLSVIPEKKERYMLPGIIPMAILIGMVVRHWQTIALEKASKVIIKVHSLVLSVVCLSFPYLLYEYGISFNELGWTVALFFSFLFLCCTGLLVYHSFKRANFKIFYVSVIVMVLFTIIGFPLRPNISLENTAYRNLTALHTSPELAHIPLYTPDTLNPIQLWEAGRKIKIIRSEADYPSSNAGILTFSPAEDTNHYSQVIEFPFDPENSERIIYLLIIPEE